MILKHDNIDDLDALGNILDKDALGNLLEESATVDDSRENADDLDIQRDELDIDTALSSRKKHVLLNDLFHSENMAGRLCIIMHPMPHQVVIRFF